MCENRRRNHQRSSGTGRSVSIVEQKITQSTSNCSEVLKRVYEKVPETAKTVIEHAIGNSADKLERATDKVAEKNAAGRTS